MGFKGWDFQSTRTLLSSLAVGPPSSAKTAKTSRPCSGPALHGAVCRISCPTEAPGGGELLPLPCTARTLWYGQGLLKNTTRLSWVYLVLVRRPLEGQPHSPLDNLQPWSWPGETEAAGYTLPQQGTSHDPEASAHIWQGVGM